MMLQMLPMLAFAEDAPDAHAVKIDGEGGELCEIGGCCESGIER